MAFSSHFDVQTECEQYRMHFGDWKEEHNRFNVNFCAVNFVVVSFSISCTLSYVHVSYWYIRQILHKTGLIDWLWLERRGGGRFFLVCVCLMTLASNVRRVTFI